MCTAKGHDPYETGDNVKCCSGLEQVLKDWDGDGRYYYKCMTIAIPQWLGGAVLI